ncbi:Uncharacterised protein [Mycolicibacterium phlei]|uniref:hypothetical protein n=1 Tax=Mycobacteroides chelonae TaxID=1774 RepID=UPI000618AC0E|nr:hypothetical protein [Mycobacteroides chelonae]VEG20104.1 Uncharacterised protein [Mycolicibacterium phlei]AKC40501.1 hypothetical protein GR01_20655 [Mycobacteroides chelonae]ANB00170.1 hypothetical protein BB28_21610 [Mycobacteroides chelonae CCUG 47445]OLT82074.1 hypothetical protein BKG56_08100 [Mycobacteroides chelonae]ORV15633.1 hypothetical protein AWB96_06195 [Mycobacteroides chelonae]
MLDTLKRTAALWWRRWPWLVAIYLVGWLLGYGALQLAIVVSVHVGGFWGDLLVPVVVFVRVCTCVLMIWVLSGENLRDSGDAGGPWAFLNRLSPAVLPVLALLAVWKLPVADMDRYQAAKIDAASFSQQGALMSADELNKFIFTTDWRMYTVIAIAFIARFVLTRLRDWLPAWTQLIAAYLEVTWIALLFFASGVKLFGTPQWISERQIVVWYNDQKAAAFRHLGVVGAVQEWVVDNVLALLPVILLPLTWLAITALVLPNTLSPTWITASQAAVGETMSDRIVARSAQAASRMRAWWIRVPAVLQSRGTEFGRNMLGIAEKLGGTARLVLHSGVTTVAFYILAFMGLVFLFPSDTFYDTNISDGLVWRAVVSLIGPHDLFFWINYDVIIRAVIGAVVDPLRFCLMVAMYQHCVERARQSVNAP